MAEILTYDVLPEHEISPPEWPTRARAMGWIRNGAERAKEVRHERWVCTYAGDSGHECGKLAPWSNAASRAEADAETGTNLYRGRCDEHMWREVEADQAAEALVQRAVTTGMRHILTIRLKGRP